MEWSAVEERYLIEYTITYADPDPPLSAGDYNFAVWISHSEYTDYYEEGTLTVTVDLRDYVTFTAIENIASNVIDANTVNIYPSDEDECIEYKINHDYISSLPIAFKIWNSLNDGKQYFIYTSSDQNYLFDDTLTFGTSHDDPIQKIWDSTEGKFTYIFTDTIIADKDKYYNICYEQPMKTWETIGRSDEWMIQLEPQTTEYDGKQHDIYTASAYSDLKNVLREYIADMDSNTTQANYEFQFTAYVDSGTISLKVGTIHETGGLETENTIVLNTGRKRYSLPIDSSSFDDQLFMESLATTSTVIYITDYALIQRNYFSKRLNILQSDYSELPVILLSNKSNKYIKEGKRFRVDSQAYDRRGDLNHLKIEVYLDVDADANRVRYYYLEIDLEDGEFIDLDYLLEGVIDLNGTSSDIRDIQIKITLYGADLNAFATQSRWYKFLQFPYFPNDVKISFTQDARKVGEQPKGHLSLKTVAPETLIGLKLVIYDEDSSKFESDYNAIWYKDTDFVCHAFDCSFDYEITDWKFEDQNVYTMIFVVLVNTENTNFDNVLLNAQKSFYIQYRTYETFRVFETFERLDHTYRNDEEIPLVLQIRDVGDYGTWANLKNDIKVYMKISNCDTDNNSGICMLQSTEYPADSFLYDEKTGHNYFFFRQLFILDDGVLLPDANYIRFTAIAEDVERVRSSTTTTGYLTTKCENDDRDTDCSSGGILGLGYCFFNNMLSSLSQFALGCTTPQASVVTTDTNAGFENRLLIDEDHGLSIPLQTCAFCINVDQNNVYRSSLKQDLLCGSWYRQGEYPIDSFTFMITNKYSDYLLKMMPLGNI